MSDKKKHVLTVTLNPAIDKTVFTDNFSLGKDHRVCGARKSAGGKGINVSRALVKLGSSTVATGIVGGMTGAFIVDAIKKDGIGSKFCYSELETRTNLTVIDRTSGRITRIIEDGPRVSKKIFQDFIKLYTGLLNQAALVIVSGANARGLPDTVYSELTRLAHKKRVNIYIDTRSKALTYSIKARPDLVKPNLEEAEYLAGRKLDTVEKVKNAAISIVQRGAKKAIITMGRDGALLSDGLKTFYAKAPKLKPVNDVGCGDSFLAAFASASLSNAGDSESLKLAVSVGAASSLTEEPGNFNRGDVERFLKQIHVENL